MVYDSYLSVDPKWQTRIVRICTILAIQTKQNEMSSTYFEKRKNLPVCHYKFITCKIATAGCTIKIEG